MKSRIALVTLVVAVVALGTSIVLAEESSEAKADDTKTSTFHVTGMSCSGCEVGVRRVVGELEGVEAVEASYDEGTAKVTYQPDKVTPDDIIAAIEKLGYAAELEESEEEDA